MCFVAIVPFVMAFLTEPLYEEGIGVIRMMGLSFQFTADGMGPRLRLAPHETGPSVFLRLLINVVSPGAGPLYSLAQSLFSPHTANPRQFPAMP